MAKKTLYHNGTIVCEYGAPADHQAEIELCRDLLKERGLWNPISKERTIFNQAVAFERQRAHMGTRSID
jgi:hypothetical protein